MTETDAEFIDGAEYAYGHHMVPQHRDRLFALARRGAEADALRARVARLEEEAHRMVEVLEDIYIKTPDKNTARLASRAAERAMNVIGWTLRRAALKEGE